MLNARLVRTLLCALALFVVAAAHADDAPLKFSVTYDKAITDSFTGRVYVMLGSGRMEPRFGPNWFAPAPLFAKDVKDWKPGEAIVFDDTAMAYPAPLSQLEAKEFAVQAVMRISLDSPTISGEGNGYSENQRLELDGSKSGTIELTIDKVEKTREFPQIEGVRELTMRSELLSKFHGRDIIMRAAAVLPKNTAEQGPALYHIPGFGGSHFGAMQTARMYGGTDENNTVTNIVLDPSCYGGHHVFADSANNGPVGEALITEFIPYIEKELGLISQPWARGVTGHSSGGWSSLWLMITYPEFFGGVWSTSPDPVDFRDFQRINLYETGANMYVDENGDTRPLARRTQGEEDQVMIEYPNFAKMEWVAGDGGQLGSFEWVFSPRGADGKPKRLFDRETGAVNHDVAMTWTKYDIRKILEDNWKTLGPKLKGKLHVHMGDVDTFYLDGAVRLLKKSLEGLGSDAVVEMHPGKDHGTIMTRELLQSIHDDVVAMFEAGKAHAEAR